MLEIGSSLREARRRRGIGLADASAATMIRVRYLEALEEERVDALPEGPYQRSFLREYAEYLGLDGDILVTEWMTRFTPPEPEAPPPPTRARGIAFELAAHRRALLAGAVLIAVALGVWQLSDSGSPTVASPPRVTVPKRPAVVRTPPPAPTASHPRRARHTSLALTAVNGPSWLLARLGSSLGPVVAERTLEPGETARFGLKKPLWIRLGAPWNLAAAIGGRSITAALPALTGNVLVTPRGVTPD